MMNRDIQPTQLADDIRVLYQKNPGQGTQSIAALLDSHFKAHSAEERSSAMRELIKQFGTVQEEAESMDRTDMMRLFGMLLGRKVEQDDLSSGELLHRLAESLNTIFDSLNQLISVINASFSATMTGEDQTIRQFIGFHLGGDDQTKSLQEYLGQINQAFLTSHEAFKKAATVKMAQVLDSLNVEEIAKERGGGLKIGPMRKAEDYEIIKEKISRVQKWFDSGRFMEDFLREFEKHCQTFQK